MNVLRASFAALAAVVSTPALAAEDLSDLAGLLNEPVVSTASKSAETAGLAPATTSIITSDDLRRYAFTTLDQAINFLGVGMLTERSYATPEIGARGVLLTGDYGNHVLLLVDGHAVNEPWDGTAYYDQSAAVPLDLVDHVEVILGPGSVLYGSSAMLGVINVITKRAKDYPGLHLVADGLLPLGAHLAGGYGQELDVGGHHGELTVGLDLHQTWGPDADYGRQDYGGVPWGGRTATHREISVPSLYARAQLGEVELAVRLAQSRRTATQILYSFDDPDNWERDRWLSLDARWSHSLSPNLGVALRLYGDLYDYFENAPSTEPGNDCLAGQDAGCTYQNYGRSRWFGAEANATYDWTGDARYVTLVGVDVRRRDVASWVAYADAATGAAPHSSDYAVGDMAVGAYVQQTLRPTSWLSVNAGLRYDYDEGVGDALSPRVAAVVPAWTGGTLKAIYAEAFRAPSFYERYYSDATTQLQAEHLRPETVRSIEGVVEQRVGSQRLRLSGFWTWWHDLVTTVYGTGNLYQYANAARVDSYGLNVDWDASALQQRLRWGAALTVADSYSIDPADGHHAPLPAAAQVFGNAHGSYDLGQGLPTLALAALFVGPRPLSGLNLDQVPDAAASLDLRAAVTGRLAQGVGLSVAAQWSTATTTAYAVGPVRDDPQQVLVLPRPGLELLIGLRFDQQP